jgi:hypothetical protein
LGVDWPIAHDDIRGGDFGLEVAFYWGLDEDGLGLCLGEIARGSSGGLVNLLYWG